MADFDPSGAKTPEQILMKLGMVDYVRDPTPHTVASPAMGHWGTCPLDFQHVHF